MQPIKAQCKIKADLILLFNVSGRAGSFMAKNSDDTNPPSYGRFKPDAGQFF